MLYILHENDQWLAPFRETFTEMGLPFSEWHMASFLPDLTVEPPLGVFAMVAEKVRHYLVMPRRFSWHFFTQDRSH